MDKYLDKIIQGDCIEILNKMPTNSVDVIFADPPYNLQLQKDLYRPNRTKVEGVDDDWDKYDSFEQYDNFTRKWLTASRRVLKKDGTIWVIGSYHNIFRVGKIMQDLEFWTLNDIIWIKTNPMPNFKGTRFNNAHETLIWAAKHKNSKYTFHYKSLKAFNDDKQMRSDWYMPICSGGERIKINGKKAHSTQKPAELLYRIIMSTSELGDIILDPFVGSGTTAAIAKRLRRRYIGIEKEDKYVNIAKKRVDKIEPLKKDDLSYLIERREPRVPFGNLVERGYVKIGENLYSPNQAYKAKVLANSTLKWNNKSGSIHQISAQILDKQSNNGWQYWHVKRGKNYVCIDELRKKYRKEFMKS